MCALLLSLGCIWGMFSYPPEINRSTEAPGSDVQIEEIKVFCMQEEKNDFTMHVGDASVTVWAKALPYGLPEGKLFEWTCSDSECLMITPSDDSVYRTCSIIKPKTKPVEIFVYCDGVRRTILAFWAD